jgi:phage repressor protein C with HTH and peptisase S24 domain
MKNLGKIIKLLREQKGWSQDELAKRIPMSQPGLNKIENGGSTRKIVDLALALGVTAEELQRGELNEERTSLTAPDLDQMVNDYPRPASKDDYAIIPQYTTKGCCGSGFHNDHVEVKGGMAFKVNWLERFGLNENNSCVITACGESMIPSINDGDILLLDQKQTRVRTGEVYAVLMDDEVIVKRLAKEFGILLLRSDNPNKASYPDISVPPNIQLEVIGRVVWRGGGM